MEETIIAQTPANPAPHPEGWTFDYSTILDKYGFEYGQENYYLVSGSSGLYKGWIMHIPVVITQLDKLLHLILPMLKGYNVKFKIPLNRDFAGAIIDGIIGFERLAHLVCIYPGSDEQALDLAMNLIHPTGPFKGPKVPTDAYLGGRVYCRFGAHNPVIADNNGLLEEWIQYPDGKMEKENVTIPFQMPPGISWPFSAITIPIPYRDIYPDNYKVMGPLKIDAKSAVIKALYQKSLFSIKWCVLKQGKQAMFNDDWDRDIADRLRWQFELHNKLQNLLSIPKAYGLYELNGDTIFSMEFIKGLQLDEVVKDKFGNSTWQALPIKSRQELIGLMQQLVNLIQVLHTQGIVHRDINTLNFILNKKHTLTLIDVELAHSIVEQKPNPPFKLGTYRFMSPQQAAFMEPAYEDDIYSLGATLIVLLTGIMPGKFALNDNPALQQQLEFFIGDPVFSSFIPLLVSINRIERPKLSEIKQQLISFAGKQKELLYKPASNGQETTRMLLQRSINGLSNMEFLSPEGLWYSKRIQEEDHYYLQMEERTIYYGLHSGLSGVMNVVAKLKLQGYDVSSAVPIYNTALAHLLTGAEIIKKQLQPGLFYGCGGVGITIINGIKAGLIDPTDDITELVQICFNRRIPDFDLSLSSGSSGQGLAIIGMYNNLDKEFADIVLKYLKTQVIKNWNKPGMWIKGQNRKVDPMKHNLTLGNGLSGAAYFLLSYGELQKDYEAITTAEVILKQIINKGKKQRGTISWQVSVENKPVLGLMEGNAGVIYTLLKAFQVTAKPEYLKVAEQGLSSYPDKVSNRDFTLYHGLAGLGHVYRFAYEIAKTKRWKDRASWITGLISHAFITDGNDSCYWEPTSGFSLTADWMIGTSGIVEYLCTENETNFKHIF